MVHGTKMHGVINIFHDHNFLRMVFHSLWYIIIGCNEQISWFMAQKPRQNNRQVRNKYLP